MQCSLSIFISHYNCLKLFTRKNDFFVFLHIMSHALSRVETYTIRQTLIFLYLLRGANSVGSDTNCQNKPINTLFIWASSMSFVGSNWNFTNEYVTNNDTWYVSCTFGLKIKGIKIRIRQKVCEEIEWKAQYGIHRKVPYLYGNCRRVSEIFV